MGGKSPLTGTIKESNAGGLVSQKLARLGVAGVVVEGKPRPEDGFSLVRLTKDGVEFHAADDLAGKGNYQTMARLWKRFGKGLGVMSIGQAGEKCLTAASIHFTDPQGRPGRAAGRGGLGALMGSKKLKALPYCPPGKHLRTGPGPRASPWPPGRNARAPHRAAPGGPPPPGPRRTAPAGL